MSKAVYVGIGGTARNVPKIYVGVNGVARRVKKGYIGVNGIARLFYDGGKPTLPSQYQPVEYIEGDSVSSGISKAVYNFSSITVDAMPMSSDPCYVILGREFVNSTPQFYKDVVSIQMLPSSNAVEFICGRPTVTNNNVDYHPQVIFVSNINKRTTMYLSTDYRGGSGDAPINNVARVDNVTESFTGGKFNPSSSSQGLLNIGGTNTRIYKCVINIRDPYPDKPSYEHVFWPCRDKLNGYVGLFDTYTQTFQRAYNGTAGPDLT